MASQVNGKQVLPEFAQDIYGPALYAEVKHFRIQHPQDRDAYLVHTCLEGPENAVYARGTAQSAYVAFPHFWQELVRPEGITVHLTPMSRAAAAVQLFVTAATPLGFHVDSLHDVPDDEVVYSWYAVGVRADQPELEVKQKKRAHRKWRNVLLHARALLRAFTT